MRIWTADGRYFSYSSIADSVIGGDRINKADHYRNIRNIWIIMIVVGPILIILSGALVIASSQPEWIKVLDEEDFDYDYWDESYSVSLSGDEIDNDLKITIRSKNNETIRIHFWIENDWGSDELNERGDTPETYSVDLGYVSYYDDFEFFITIEDDIHNIHDLEVSVMKSDIPDSFYGFCAASSMIGLIGMLLLVLGIIFTVVYNGRIKEQDPQFIRENMIRKQESMMREQQARKAMEMERVRQRQAMEIRARNLETSYRLDEAAFLYDRLGMFDDAVRCRRKRGEEVSRHIHVNANDIFEQLQRHGTAIPYLCMKCHGMIDIDGTKNRHTKCPYCGAPVDFENLKRAAGNLLQ